MEINQLNTSYFTSDGTVNAVEGVSLSLEKGHALGIAGESGCGKTTVALSSMKLLPSNAKITSGNILFNGEDLVKKTENEMNRIRWKKIALVFQGAMNALNPVFKVGDQIVEAIQTHDRKITRADAVKKTRELLELVGVDPARAEDFPHEFSGGMKQRAVIAMALSCDPDVLIADEPTTALDVITQGRILTLVRELQAKLGLSLIVITHDLSLTAEICSEIAIMYAGKVVEFGKTTDIYNEPMHPYTNALLSAFPSILGPIREMKTLPGFPPDLRNPPQGCRLMPRCPYAEARCEKEPQLGEITPSHFAACYNWEKVKQTWKKLS
ncbi:MAG TPA: ABC transporter ATP-binding protein [Candidatus Acidoferrales bacterium]|nr:ABC transporter ATP-binding protein [Candidatus Acidoferrales bacterium]